MEWMEAIEPGSSEPLQRFSKSGSLHRTNTPQASYNPYSVAGPDPSVSNGHYDSVDVGSSWRNVEAPGSVPHQPANYVMPVPSQENKQRTHQHERTLSEDTFDKHAISPPPAYPGSSSADARLIHSINKSPQHAHPRQTSHRSTFAHSDREKKTASLSRTSTEIKKSPEQKVASSKADEHLYELDAMNAVSKLSSKPPLPHRPPPTAKPRNKLTSSLSDSQARASGLSPGGDTDTLSKEPEYPMTPQIISKEPEYPSSFPVRKEPECPISPDFRKEPVCPISLPGSTPQQPNFNKPPIARRRQVRQPKPVEEPPEGEHHYLDLSEGVEPEGPKPASPRAKASPGAQASPRVKASPSAQASRSPTSPLAMPGISEQMLKNFTPDQLDTLIGMLHQVRSGGEQQPAVNHAAEQGANSTGLPSDQGVMRRKNFGEYLVVDYILDYVFYQTTADKSRCMYKPFMCISLSCTVIQI